MMILASSSHVASSGRAFGIHLQSLACSPTRQVDSLSLHWFPQTLPKESLIIRQGDRIGVAVKRITEKGHLIVAYDKSLRLQSALYDAIHAEIHVSEIEVI